MHLSHQKTRHTVKCRQSNMLYSVKIPNHKISNVLGGPSCLGIV